VKLAMIRVDEMIRTNPVCKDTVLLLQIHDELVFEVDNESIDTVVPLLVETMENVIALDVAMTVRT
jgi:DNA polymerase-1